MLYNFASNVFLTSIVAALGTNALPASSPQQKQILADYDDITVDNPTAPTQAVGTYKGLTYNEFSLSAQLLQGEGLQPHSRPNTPVFSVVGGLTGALAGDGDHYIKSDNNLPFGLEELYYGCTVLSAESAVNVPTSCTMVFTGKDAAGNQVAEQSASFGGASEMNRIQFEEGFSNVHRVDFSISGLGGLLAVGVIDDLMYTK